MHGGNAQQSTAPTKRCPFSGPAHKTTKTLGWTKSRALSRRVSPHGSCVLGTGAGATQTCVTEGYLGLVRFVTKYRTNHQTLYGATWSKI